MFNRSEPYEAHDFIFDVIRSGAWDKLMQFV